VANDDDSEGEKAADNNTTRHDTAGFMVIFCHSGGAGEAPGGSSKRGVRHTLAIITNSPSSPPLFLATEAWQQVVLVTAPTASVSLTEYVGGERLFAWAGFRRWSICCNYTVNGHGRECAEGKWGGRRRRTLASLAAFDAPSPP
jgi:hypothetical protein